MKSDRPHSTDSSCVADAILFCRDAAASLSVLVNLPEITREYFSQ